MYDTALRKRIVALVIAALLSVAGASVTAATVAGEVEARDPGGTIVEW